MQTQQDLLTTAYAAFNDRDIDAVLAVMHPDVAWANGMEGGHVHGHERLVAYESRFLVKRSCEPYGRQR
ncbi:MAG: nuclear transport factor 2 family protein [Plectolyngbya sp. WJT66-NPBG17]|jgi:ketosteroid isomerase-like protein|nr:nuclear transport factor 2 family protein [Plectolyngbya sp. WJT66-NPBG17]MBW4529022.1 nuclear transport factor 2 family protein [Phormidium tanganyikae FI6-MK23]